MYDETTTTEKIIEKPATEPIFQMEENSPTKKPSKPTRKKKKTKPTKTTTTTTTEEPEVEEPEETIEEESNQEAVVDEENSINEVSDEEQIDCSDNERDYVASSKDCKTYYRCVHNQPVQFICMEAGTVFHTQLNVCVWPVESDRDFCKASQE